MSSVKKESDIPPHLCSLFLSPSGFREVGGGMQAAGPGMGFCSQGSLRAVGGVTQAAVH